MKPSSHKTTMLDVLAFLVDGPQPAWKIGERFWPDKCRYGPSRGGPDSASVAASYLLGRMARRGWVEHYFDRSKTNYSLWQVTDEGHKKLREEVSERRGQPSTTESEA